MKNGGNHKKYMWSFRIKERYIEKGKINITAKDNAHVNYFKCALKQV